MPSVTPAPTTTSSIVHVVQKGENLFRISLCYNVRTQTIAAANGIANIHKIYAGQKLVIPTGGTVTTGTTTIGMPVMTQALPPSEPDYVFVWKGC